MTLQEKYNAINEGAFSKQQFLRDARLAFPQIISQFNSYEDASQILKNRGIIGEAEKKPEPVKFDPADKIAPDVLDQGIKAELEKKGLPVNQSPTSEEYAAAKKKAVANITKDLLYYKNAQTMASSKSEKMEKAKTKLNEGQIKKLAELILEAKLAEEMSVHGDLQKILDTDTPKVAQGAAIALEALKKFYAASENLTRKLEKAYKVTGPFMAPALGAAVVKQINDIVVKPYKAEMPKAKMVNIAKINDFETLARETGISVDDLKAMQRQFKSGTVALPTVSEAKKRNPNSLLSLLEADSNTTDFQSLPTQRPDGTYDISNVMKEADGPMYVNGREVDPNSIEFETEDFGDGPISYAASARFLEGGILDDSELEVLNQEYFENNYVRPEDYYDTDMLDMYEAKKKPSAGLTKKEKSAIVKKAKAGEDIGKKGEKFADVAKAAGGGEKGQKIAAAAMWKAQAAKKKG